MKSSWSSGIGPWGAWSISNNSVLDRHQRDQRDVEVSPDAKVIDWLGDQRPADLFLASMSLGELVRGARRAKDKTKRERFERWIDYDLAARFDGRILPFDREAAVIWGEIMGDGDRLGHPKPMADAQIAAVARRHNLIVATRNARDFRGMDVAILDPWTSG